MSACELCNGVAKIGIPGQRCFACDGTGKSKFTGNVETQPASLCDRLIAAIEGECDGLAITAEQASNILAYLQYGEPMEGMQGADARPVAIDDFAARLETLPYMPPETGVQCGWNAAISRVREIYATRDAATSDAIGDVIDAIEDLRLACKNVVLTLQGDKFVADAATMTIVAQLEGRVFDVARAYRAAIAPREKT